MNKIAHLKVTCPQCGKYTSIYVVEDGGSGAKVKCEHCKQVFVFGAGMAYEPVAYVPSIPRWAVISKDDEKKTFSQAIKCQKCGNSYNESDLALAGINQKRKSEGDETSALFSGMIFDHLLKETSKILYKCSSCSKIACSNCAPDGDGITGKRCPFCETDYTIYSKIEPSEENISKGDEMSSQQAETSTDFKALKQKKKRPIAITIICILGFLGVAFSIPILFSGAAGRIGDWYPPYAGFCAVIGLVCMVGLWLMKKWAACTYAGFVALNQIVLLSMGVWKPNVLIIPAIVIGVTMAYIKEMD